MTVTDSRQDAATGFAEHCPMTADELAEWLAGEVKRLCAEAAEQILLQRLQAGIQAEFTPQDAVLAQLKALRALARLVNLRTDGVLVEGNSLGLSNPTLAGALGLKSGEAVRQRLLARGVAASPVAK